MSQVWRDERKDKNVCDCGRLGKPTTISPEMLRGNVDGDNFTEE